MLRRGSILAQAVTALAAALVLLPATARFWHAHHHAPQPGSPCAHHHPAHHPTHHHHPTPAQPVSAEPDSSEPASVDPAHHHPTSDQPVHDQPVPDDAPTPDSCAVSIALAQARTDRLTPPAHPPAPAPSGWARALAIETAPSPVRTTAHARGPPTARS